jgi:hypothetical protein
LLKRWSAFSQKGVSRIEVKNMADVDSKENGELAPHVNDIGRLTRTELQRKYRPEYNSWRNGKSRAKPAGNWAPEFEDFASFLRVMGPKEPGDTLDRINSNDLYYGPAQCRWASKSQQANNRSTTVFVRHDGVERPLSEVSAETGHNPDTVRKRVRRSWGGDDPLQSSPPPDFGRDPRGYKPWPKKHDPKAQRAWEKRYHQSNGIQQCSRHAFLISTLRLEIDRVQRMLRDYDAVHPDEWPLIVREDYELMLRCQEHLMIAEIEVPKWELALRDFNSRRAERIALTPGKPWFDKRETDADWD